MCLLAIICFSCNKHKSRLPSVLFDSLTNQVVFVTDSSRNQKDDYMLNKSRLIFLNRDIYAIGKDSFILRLFIDDSRRVEKRIIEINCYIHNCFGKEFVFNEFYDGKTYLRQNIKEYNLAADDWKLFFDSLLVNKLLTLPNNTENNNCFNRSKDGATYSIQLLNYSGERFYTYDNPEYFDSSCVSGLYFNKLIKHIKTLQIKK